DQSSSIFQQVVSLREDLLGTGKIVEDAAKENNIVCFWNVGPFVEIRYFVTYTATVFTVRVGFHGPPGYVDDLLIQVYSDNIMAPPRQLQTHETGPATNFQNLEISATNGIFYKAEVICICEFDKIGLPPKTVPHGGPGLQSTQVRREVQRVSWQRL